MSAGRIRWIAVAALAMLAVSGCRKSRIHDSDTIDVCGLVGVAEAERVLGQAVGAPAANQKAPGFAGGCTWSFNTATGIGRLSADVMTRESASNLVMTPRRWFEDPVRLADAKANLGTPAEIRRLGDIAYLYGSMLSVRQGETVILLHVDRGDGAPLEDFARILLSPKKD